MKKIISLIVSFIILFTSSFWFTFANYNNNENSNFNNINYFNNNFGKVSNLENLKGYFVGTETNWVKTWVAKKVLKWAAKLCRLWQGKFQDKFIIEWIRWDKLTKLTNKREIIARKLEWLADELDNFTVYTTQMWIDYLSPILWTELATEVTSVLAFIIW